MRLDRIRARMQRRIDAGRLAGGVGLIARRGYIGYFESWGVREDAIFRIFSMTKAVTAVAAMMLFEEGAFAVADPVSHFLPEFRQTRLAVEAMDTSTGKMVLTGTVPAVRLQLHGTSRRKGRSSLRSARHSAPERHPPTMCSGGGGLMPTALDYQRFVSMLLEGGVLDG